jgi:hypothetical protein
MEPIHVPGPPKEAFNKNRRISDLIRAQINHLKHLEFKLPANVRQQIPQHRIVTEDDAARYIAPMTRLLRAQAVAGAPAQTPVGVRRPTPIRPVQGLALAAGAEDGKVAAKSASSAAPKASPSKSKTAGPSPKRKKR